MSVKPSGEKVRRCPKCQRNAEQDSCVSNPGGVPSPGDFSICLYCESVLIFDNNLDLVPFTGEIPEEVKKYVDGMRAIKRLFPRN